MDMTQYRNSPRQQTRVADLLSHVSREYESILDIGARDGYISRELAKKCRSVTALDLKPPPVTGPNITAVAGDVTALEFDDNTFGCVVCAEVLEHIHPSLLEKACREIARVTAADAIIGVPYRQDLRAGRTTCRQCGTVNPAWGHFTVFTKKSLLSLFPSMQAEKISFVGRRLKRTNFLSAMLRNAAGNPRGEYSQDEPCICCGAALIAPDTLTRKQRFLCMAAFVLDRIQKPFIIPSANWIHVRFRKSSPDLQ
jgi:SAM-dependent methyltransferase